jgi:hypothetical protein
MAAEGSRRGIVIKHNRYARHQACSLCNADRPLPIGPGLFEEDTWQGVCDDCAQEHAPGLLAMLRAPAAQRAYWEAVEHAGAQQRTEVGQTLASIEAELAGLQALMEAAQRRLGELREGEE